MTVPLYEPLIEAQREIIDKYPWGNYEYRRLVEVKCRQCGHVIGVAFLVYGQKSDDESWYELKHVFFYCSVLDPKKVDGAEYLNSRDGFKRRSFVSTPLVILDHSATPADLPLYCSIHRAKSIKSKKVEQSIILTADHPRTVRV